MGSNSTTSGADVLYNKAQRLLEKYDLLGIAQKHFDDAFAVGSAVTNLMYRPDVDLTCIVKPLTEKEVTGFVTELTASLRGGEIRFYDHLKESPFAL